MSDMLNIPNKATANSAVAVGDARTTSLTRSQMLIWTGQKLNPDLPLYNMVMTFRIHGALSSKDFQTAFTRLVEESDAMRTVFVEKEGLPVQNILDEIESKVNILDFTTFDNPEHAAETWCTECARKPLDISNGLFDCVLLHLSDTDWIWYYNQHHLMNDGWSVTLVFKRVSNYYQQLIGNSDIVIKPLPQYHDYRKFEAGQNAEEVNSASRVYWKEKLETPVGPLALYGKTPDLRSTAGNRIFIELSRKQSEALREIAKEPGIRSFTLDLSLYYIFSTLLTALLSRVCGQKDITFGAPVHNRSTANFKETVGLFIEMFPMHLELEQDENFRSLLKKVALETQNLLRHSGPGLSTAEINNSFNVTLNFINASFGNFADLQTTSKWIHPGDFDQGNSFSLLIHDFDDTGVFKLHFDINTDTFSAGECDQLVNDFFKILDAFIESRDTIIDEVELLNKKTASELLVAFNETSGKEPAGGMNELFAEAVQINPTAAALSWEGEETSFAELDVKSNQLANYFIANGMKEGDIVGICLERKPVLLISLLAVQKVGAAFVAIDLQLPKERQHHMLSDSDAAWLITENGEKSYSRSLKMICLETEKNDVESHSKNFVAVVYKPEKLAYILYTSGSTGMPKGVRISNRAMVNYLNWARKVYMPTSGLSMALFSTISADLTITSLFLPLISGGRAVLYTQEGQGTDLSIVRVANEDQVDIIKLTPSHLSLVDKQLFSSKRLKTLILGGEDLKTKAVAELHEAGIAVYNEYGPTEATVGCMIHQFDPKQDVDSSVPIGKPIDNTQIYLLNQKLQPVPPGTPGEIYIGGSGLASGYHNLPEETAEKFIPNPFSKGKLLYKTGDLARFNNTGLLQYLGRNDEQMKLGGFRIEPSEVEAALIAVPAIRNAVVDIAKITFEQNQEKRLVAFYTAESQVDETQLRNILAAKLPYYMVPAHLFPLEALPVNSTGKIDKARLPDVEELLKRNRSTMRPAETDLQQKLVQIWEDVLKYAPIGIDDHFLAIGGGSLQAVSITAKIIQELSVELPLQTLFEISTVSELAKLIESKNSASKTEYIVGKSRSKTEAPLSAAQRRIWYLQSLQPESYAYNMHQVTLLDGYIDEEKLRKSVMLLAESHNILRTLFVEKETELLQMVQPSVNDIFQVVDYTNRAIAIADKESRKDCIREFAKAEAMKPFSLDTLPLWKLTYLKLGENAAGLVLVMHHIISDEWSVDVFWQQLAAAYSDDHMEKVRPDIQYADYSKKEQEWLEGKDWQRHADFWSETLVPEPEKLQLGRNETTESGFKGLQASIGLKQDTIENLKKMALEENASLFMISLAAYSILLHKLYGKKDLCIGTPVTLRDRPELLKSIGFFLNTLPIRIDVDDSLTFREHLRKVRQITLDAFANKMMPFDLLVKQLRPQVSGNDNPFFQTMLVLHKDGIENLSFDNVKAEALHIDNEVAKFDLTLFLKEGKNEFVAMAEYSNRIFTPDTIHNFLKSWVELLDNVQKNPDVGINTLSYLADTDRNQIITMGAGPGVEIGAKPIHELISRNAVDSPEQEAIRYDDTILTYPQLVKRANGLANVLISMGKREKVGIYLERGIDFPVAILGVLQSGAAYVPLDPEYPTERIQYILDDAQIETVISTAEIHKTLDGTSATVILIEGVKESTEIPDTSVDLDDDAYLIYTSGSTGKPKGVQISHRNLLYSTLARRTFYPDKPTSYLMLSSFSFDSSVAGIFWSLVEGGTLCLPDKNRYMEPDYLTGFIQKHSITHLLAIPSFYQQLLGYDAKRLESLSTVIVAGEALRPALIDEHYKTLPNCLMVNEYGPTEATVWASAAAVSKNPRNTIGKAVGATRLYVMNENGTPVLPGMPGELYIGGPQVAKGYFNKPELTRERFLPDPFNEGEILYRTGDQVCWTSEGELSFLGRVDNQVKIRGHRIEPEEIENTISQLSSVKEAAVLPVSKRKGSNLREPLLKIVQEQDWTTFAERFGSEELDSLLAEVEQLSVTEAEALLPQNLWLNQGDLATSDYQKSHREKDFAIKLDLLQKGFIAPPRDAQRNWMIGQWMAEATEDLHHLHDLAKRFVSGETTHGEIYDEKADALHTEEIMEDWQTPVMKAMARQVAAAHGDVLEIGFGIGVSATFIQEQGVKSHTIVEMNEYIANTLFADWRKKYPENEIKLVLGRWQDALDKLEAYDGVFFHAVPMDEEEFMQEMVGSITFAEHFFPVAASLLRPGGVFTYMTTEIDSLSRRHQRALFKHFSSITMEVEPLVIPEDTKDWWWADSMVVVKATK